MSGKEVHWVTPPCEHHSSAPRSAAAERIRAGVAKYLAEHPFVEIDGEQFQIIDIGIARGLTPHELLRLQGFQSPLVAIDHDATAIEKHMTDHNKLQHIRTIQTGDVVAAMQDQNLITWLELEALKHGTENQRERHLANVLPEDELTQIARAVLFKDFGNIRRPDGTELSRWASRNLSALGYSLKHRGDAHSHPHIDYEHCDLTESTADEWTTIKAVNQVAESLRHHPWLERGGMVTVTTTTHWATCTVCQAEACKSSIKVSIAWAGRVLVREYAL